MKLFDPPPNKIRGYATDPLQYINMNLSIQLGTLYYCTQSTSIPKG